VDKLQQLGEAAQWDICATDGCFGRRGQGRRRAPSGLPKWIYPAVRPDGQHVLLMKVLMSAACQNSCAYCANRCGRNEEKAGFAPAELAGVFLDFHRRNLARGLFLSSAVPDSPDQTMDRMLTAVEILRLRHRFTGYVHLKILPGASYDRVQRAVELADRVSINLEAPGPGRLHQLAPEKDFQEDLLTRMAWVKKLTSQPGLACRGQTTQFVVGASGETDAEILTRGAQLYQEMDLERCYYSAFSPVAGTPLAEAPPTPLIREHRLYQADFLLRRYGWQVEEMVLDHTGNLPLDMDPKLAWARAHPEYFPVEVNQAGLSELLRIPGVGPRSARRILARRGKLPLKSLDDLREVGAVATRGAGYVLLAGRRAQEARGQLPLDLSASSETGLLRERRSERAEAVPTV